MIRKPIFWALLFFAGWGYAKYQHALDCAAAGGEVWRGLCEGETR